jgi:hypothetical protein
LTTETTPADPCPTTTTSTVPDEGLLTSAVRGVGSSPLPLAVFMAIIVGLLSRIPLRRRLQRR